MLDTSGRYQTETGSRTTGYDKMSTICVCRCSRITGYDNQPIFGIAGPPATRMAPKGPFLLTEIPFRYQPVLANSLKLNAAATGCKKLHPIRHHLTISVRIDHRAGS